MDLWNTRFLIDKKIRLETNEGIYEGLVQSADYKSNFLSIYKAVFMETNKPVPNVLTFSSFEILRYELLDSIESKFSDEITDGDSLMLKKKRPKHLDKLESLDHNNLFLTNPSDFLKGTGKNELLTNIKKFDSPEIEAQCKKQYQVAENSSNDSKTHHYAELTPSSYTVLDKFGDNFSNSIKHIKQQKVIGVAMEGITLSRQGELCWIQIATQVNAFLFDVFLLEDDVFKNGLKEILEDEQILKVIHDCRQISDILCHKYNIMLYNVFDTQVADVVIYRMLHKDYLPRYVKSLHSCLLDYLNLTPEQVHFQRVRQKYMQEDQAIWQTRPLSESLLDALAKRVIYLKSLRLAVLDKMLTEFRTGVDIYLAVIRDANEENVDQLIKSSYQLPSMFRELNTFSSQHFRGNRNSNQFQDNFEPIHDPEIRPSRDIWHRQVNDDKFKTLKLPGRSLSPKKTDKVLTNTPFFELMKLQQADKKDMKSQKDSIHSSSVNTQSESAEKLMTHSSLVTNQSEYPEELNFHSFSDNTQSEPAKVMNYSSSVNTQPESDKEVIIHSKKLNSLTVKLLKLIAMAEQQEKTSSKEELINFQLPPLDDVIHSENVPPNHAKPLHKEYKPLYVPSGLRNNETKKKKNTNSYM